MFQLVHHFNKKSDFKKAYLYGIRALDIDKPASKAILVDESVYDYKLLDELTVAAAGIGLYAKGVQYCNKLLEKGTYPKAAEAAIYQNKDQLSKLLAESHMENLVPIKVAIDPTKKSVLFYVSSSPIFRKEKYGSEIAVENLSKNLTKSVNVFIASDDCQRISNIDGVHYVPSSYILEKYFDVIVVSRFLDYFVKFTKNCGKLYLWLHDIHAHAQWISEQCNVLFPDDGRHLLKNVDTLIDGYVTLCPWHKENTIAKYGLARDKVHIIGNGMVRGNLVDNPTRDPNKFIWVSDQCRGLRETVLEFFPRLLKLMPNAYLEIYRDLHPDIIDRLKDIKYVKLKGLKTNAEIVEAFKTSEYFVYPTAWPETFCISALEAAANGALVITSDLAALQHTCGALVTCKRIYSEAYWDELIGILERLENDPEKKSAMRQKGMCWAANQTWDVISNKWLQLFGMFVLEELDSTK
jgi:glycosyltransferase involved in cell wall biosynthesis